MKVSALIAATLLVASVSAQADNHGDHAKKATAPAAKAAKGTTTTTTTTTTTAAAAATAPAADHMDCTKLTGKAKTECEMHEKAAHKTGEAHTH